MNLEELQGMSDAELNKLAGAKVMGWIVRHMAGGWNPTSSMTDAMMLISKPEIMDRVQIGVYPTSFGKWIARSFMPGYDITVQDESPSRAITIASILAKEGTE